MIDKEILTAVEYLQNSTESNYRIARHTQVSQPSIAKYRRGESIPGLSNARSIIAYFKHQQVTGTTPEITDPTDIQQLADAIERRDIQIQDLLDQQRRLISIIEKMQGTEVPRDFDCDTPRETKTKIRKKKKAEVV